MNYSRRQLEAFGETLGDSVTRKEGGRIIYGGGGSAPPSTSTSVTDLPDWAKPYAQESLEKGKQLTASSKMAQYDQPRIAGFSPMQQQAQEAAANMGTSGQLGTATGLATAAGLSGLGAAYQPGQFRNQFRAPAAYQSGDFGYLQAQAPELERYQMDPTQQVSAQSFLQPGTSQAYMSPYMQDVVAQQQKEAIRQSDILGTQQAGQAVQSGAFGGSRAGLLEAERQRNLGTQLGQIQAAGLQSGFQNAQQQFNAEQQARMQAALANQQAGLTTGIQNLNALLGVQQLGAGQSMQSQLANQQANLAAQQAAEQSRQYGYGQAMNAAQQRAQYGQAAQQLGEQSRQFGAGYGLQGLGTALQAAGQLGNLGQAEFGQAKDIIGLQSQLGAQQQALRQQGLSQAYQDFLNEQNYPYKQLGFMSDLIRGLPLGQQTTSQVYQSPGNMMGQIAGLGLGLGSMAKAGSTADIFAEGGQVKGYADGGSVNSDANVESILDGLSKEQLQQAKAAAINRGDQARVDMIDAKLAEIASMEIGLGSLPVDFTRFMPDEKAMANGGIVAFAKGDLVDDDTIYDPATGVPMYGTQTQTGEDTTFREAIGLGNVANRRAQEEAELRQRMAAVPKRAEPTAKDKEIMERAAAESAAPAPSTRAARAPAKGITQAAQIVTDVVKTQVPKDDVGKLYEDVLAKMKEAPSPDAEALAKALAVADKRAEDIKVRGVSEALMKFGFGMAAEAAKPGKARRAGIFGALESAAAASPILAESLAENEKLQAAAEDNALKLRMEQMRYKSALEQGNKQLAASLAGSISQRNLQQATLEEQIAQHARANALKEKEIAGMAAARAQSAEPPLVRIAERYMRENPSLSFDQAMTAASKAAGYSFRTEGAMGGKLAAALTKIDDDYKMLPALMAGNPNSPFVQQMAADQKRRREEAYRLYGAEEQSSGVGSGKASQVYRFDARGNPIQ